MQHFSRIRNFMLELDRSWGPGAVYRGGEPISGRVVLDITKGLKVRALAVCARGLATAHWLESKSIGMNTVYSDYTAYETYLRRRQSLIRGEKWCFLLFILNSFTSFPLAWLRGWKYGSRLSFSLQLYSLVCPLGLSLRS